MSGSVGDSGGGGGNGAAAAKALVTKFQAQLDGVYAACGLPCRYTLTQKLGGGGYGTVFEARDVETGQEVAVKCIHQNALKYDAHRIFREIVIMHFFRDAPLLMSLRDIAPVPNPDFQELFLVMDVMDCDLKKAMQTTSMTDSHVRFLMYQILCGLHTLHSAACVHRDLSPYNVLISRDLDLKICDFGLARTLHNQTLLSDYVVRRWYRAPEVVMESREYADPVDVWGAGCILAEFYNSAQALFPGHDRVDQLRAILTVIGTPSEDDIRGIGSEPARHFVSKKLSGLPPADLRAKLTSGAALSDEGLDLLKRMLTFNPLKRITVVEAMRHPYFKEYYDPKHEEVPPEKFTLDQTAARSKESVAELQQRIFETVRAIRAELAASAAGPAAKTVTPPPEITNF